MGRVVLSAKYHFKKAVKRWRPNRSVTIPERVTRRVNQWVAQQQRRFDAQIPSSSNDLTEIARQTSVVISSRGPFRHVSNLVRSMVDSGDLVPGEIVIGDTTAERIRGQAVREPLEQWRSLLPGTSFRVASYPKQDFNFSEAYNCGAAAATGKYLLVLNDDILVTPGWFTYLIRAFLGQSCKGVVFPLVLFADGKIQFFGHPEVPHLKGKGYIERLKHATDYAALDTSAPPRALEELQDLPVLEEGKLINGSVFFGARDELIDQQSGQLFDPAFVNETQDDDIAIRLAARGAKITAVSASVVFHLSQATRGFPPLWELLHDHIWLNQKWKGDISRPAERIELICPFHRGDVLLALQAAHQATLAGGRVRLHVAKGLVPWVKDFDLNFEVEELPVPVATAEKTFKALQDAYQFVVQRPDASHRVARMHPKTSLGATGRNLLEHVFEQLGMPIQSQLENCPPRCSEDLQNWGRELLAGFGDRVLLLHPSGGWDLKSIPDRLGAQLAERVREHGFKLIQIGGKADVQVGHCDGAILENYTPSKWRAIFEAAEGLLGVDSWSAHFASILDIPQVTFYGSTHPRNVHSKSFFVRKKSPSLTLGPAVSCSPCDSLVCVRYTNAFFVGAKNCAGYTLGNSSELDEFLKALG